MDTQKSFSNDANFNQTRSAHNIQRLVYKLNPTVRYTRIYGEIRVRITLSKGTGRCISGTNILLYVHNCSVYAYFATMAVCEKTRRFCRNTDTETRPRPTEDPKLNHRINLAWLRPDYCKRYYYDYYYYYVK